MKKLVSLLTAFILSMSLLPSVSAATTPDEGYVLNNAYSTDMSAWKNGMSASEAATALGLDEIVGWSNGTRSVTAERKTDVPQTASGNVAAAFVVDNSADAWVDQKTAGLVKTFSAKEGKVYINFDLHIENTKRTQLDFVQLTDSKGTTKTLKFGAHIINNPSRADSNWGFNGGCASIQLVYDLETATCVATVDETAIGTQGGASALDETQDFTEQIVGLADLAKVKLLAPVYTGWMAYDNFSIKHYVKDKGQLITSYKTDMSAWTEGMDAEAAAEALELDSIVGWSGTVAGLPRTVTAERKTGVPLLEADDVVAAFVVDPSDSNWIPNSTAGITKSFSATKGKVYIDFDLHIEQKKNTPLSFIELTDSKGTTKKLTFAAHQKNNPTTAKSTWGYNGGMVHVAMIYDVDTGACTAKVAANEIGTEPTAAALNATQEFTFAAAGLADLAKIKFAAPAYIGWMAYDNLSIENYVEDKGTLVTEYKTDMSGWTEGMTASEAATALDFDEIVGWSGTVADLSRTVTAERKTGVPLLETNDVVAAFVADNSSTAWIDQKTAGLVKTFSATEGKVYISFDCHIAERQRTQLNLIELTDSNGVTKSLTFGAHTVNNVSKTQGNWGYNGGKAHVTLVYDIDNNTCTATVSEAQKLTEGAASALDVTQDFTEQIAGLANLTKIKFVAPLYIGWMAYDNISIANYLPKVAATGVDIAESSMTLQEGFEYKPTATVSPANASDRALSWSSSAESVATVSADGTITAVGVGTATISAALTKNNAVSDSMTVTVKERKEDISVQIADNNQHRYPSRYFDLIEEFYTAGTQGDRTFSGHAWKNDHVTSRIDIFTMAESYPDAKLVVSDFTGSNGTIAAENMTATFMRDIFVEHNNEGVEIGERVSDIITHDSVKTLEKTKMYSAWVDLYVPATAAAGSYTGTVTLQKSTGETLATCTYNLSVLDKTLPETFSTPMEMWTSPYTINRYFSGQTSNEYFGITDSDKSNLVNVKLDPRYDDALRESLKLYKKAGGTAITVTVLEDAWGDSSRPDPYPSMVKWTKETDGSFSFDYSDLDKWVAMNIEEGISQQIKSFSMTPWGNTIMYYDKATESVVKVSPSVGSDEWKSIWGSFLADYESHMRSKNWLDKTYISVDERPISEVKEVLDLIDEKAPGLKSALAINTYDSSESAQAVYDRVDDLSLTDFLPNYYSEFVDERMSKGLMTTVYDCGKGAGSLLCHPGDSAYTLYHSKWAGVDGYLRWALDYYNEDPLNTTAHPKVRLAPGDINLIYPSERDAAVGARYSQSSPRFEKYIEGMRELEKIKILKNEYPDYTAKIDNLLQMASTIKTEVTGADLTAEATTGKEAGLIRDGLYAIAKEAFDTHGGLSIENLSDLYTSSETIDFDVTILKDFQTAAVSSNDVELATIAPISGQKTYAVSVDAGQLIIGDNDITVTVVYADGVSRSVTQPISVMLANGSAWRQDMSAWTEDMSAEEAETALGIDEINGNTYTRNESAGTLTINVAPQRGVALNKRTGDISLAFKTDQYNDKQANFVKSMQIGDGKVLINFEYYVERAINSNLLQIAQSSGSSQTFGFNLKEFAWNQLSVLLDLDAGTYSKTDYKGTTSGSLNLSDISAVKFMATPYSKGAVAGFDNIDIVPFSEQASVSISQSEVSVSNISTAHDLFVASYSGSKLISCVKVNVSGDTRKSFSELEGFVTTGADTAKAFLVNAALSPICAADSVSLTK